MKLEYLIVKCAINTCLLFVLNTQIVLASECVPWKEEYGLRAHLVVGEIYIDTDDIFNLNDTKESLTIHRITNRLHVTTKGSVISQQLLFANGDTFNLSKLEETERHLRANSYIKNASVKPTKLCGNHVTIQIHTSDVWTLTPGVSFGRSGGKSKSGFEVQEHNLLGLGKNLSLSYKHDTERNSTLLTYSDHLLFGTRKSMDITLQNNSDGKGFEFNLGLPFYQFDSYRAWGINTSSINQKASLYDNGRVVDKVAEEKDAYSLFYGWSKGKLEDHTSRFKVGWLYRSNQYKSVSDQTFGSTTSQSLVESYPWFEYEYRQDKFITKSNFRTMDQIEDVSLGLNLSAGLGLLHQQLGSDNNQLKLSTRIGKGYELGTKDLGFIEFQANTYLGSGLLQGQTLSLRGSWYSFNQTGNDLYLSGQITEKNNLLPGEQIILGGSNGLRAYPTGYQAGDKAILLTAEKRFHFNWYPFHLVKCGAVAFTDIGTAWGNNNNSKLLADVGVGLRLIPTRSNSAKAVHLDLAIPLNDRNQVDDVQVLITTKNSF